MTDRDFDLGDVLSITTGLLLSPRGMDGVYDICSFLAGESVFTHQLPRVSDEAKPVILRRYPQLAEVVVPKITPENAAAWLADQKQRFGETLAIAPLTVDQHERIDPISELAEKVHPSKIRVIVMGEDGKPLSDMLDPRDPAANVTMARLAFEDAVQKASKRAAAGEAVDVEPLILIAHKLDDAASAFIGEDHPNRPLLRKMIIRTTALAGVGEWKMALDMLPEIRERIP